MMTFKSVLRSLRNLRLGGKLLKTVGYSTLFSVLFTVFLVWSLPLDRFIPSIEGMVEQSLGRKVRIGDLSTTVTGGLLLSNMTIGTKKGEEDVSPKATEEMPSDEESQSVASKPSLSYSISEAKLNLSFIPLLFGELSAELRADALGGEIQVAYKGRMPGDEKEGKRKLKRKKKRKNKKSKKGKKNKDTESDSEADEDENEDDENETVPVALKVDIHDIALQQVHDLRELLPVPIKGNMELAVDLESTTDSFTQSSGKMTFSMTDLQFSKKGHEADVMGSSLLVPPIVVQSLEGEIAFKEGTGKVTQFKMVSPHVDLKLEGTVELRDPISKSISNLYLTFKIKDKYLSDSAAIKTLYTSIDTFSSVMRRAHRTDDYYGFQYRGIFGKTTFIPVKSFTVPGEKKEKKTKRSRKKRRPRKSRTKRTPKRPSPPVTGPTASSPSTPAASGPFNPGRPPGAGNAPFNPGRRAGDSAVRTAPRPSPNFGRNERADFVAPPSPRPTPPEVDDEDEEMAPTRGPKRNSRLPHKPPSEEEEEEGEEEVEEEVEEEAEEEGEEVEEEAEEEGEEEAEEEGEEVEEEAEEEGESATEPEEEAEEEGAEEAQDEV